MRKTGDRGGLRICNSFCGLLTQNSDKKDDIVFI